jgi:hypothetical protein
VTAGHDLIGRDPAVSLGIELGGDLREIAESLASDRLGHQRSLISSRYVLVAWKSGPVREETGTALMVQLRLVGGWPSPSTMSSPLS